MPDRAEQFRAMLVGTAIGDALGWPFEFPRRVIGQPVLEGSFYRWRRRAGSRFWSYEEQLPPGTYSDDTQLTVATGRALLQEDWFEHFVGRELPTWRLYERGGGATVLSSADAWTQGSAPWCWNKKSADRYFRSGANGAAMRIAPHVAFMEDLLPRVTADAVATHGHPRALLGATLHAWSLSTSIAGDLGTDTAGAITAALDTVGDWADASLLAALPESWHDAAGDDYPEKYEGHRDGTVALLRRALEWARQGALVAETEVLDDLGATQRATNGAGDVCAVAALYLAARYASQPEQAFQAATRQAGADTDTLGSMVGALLGARIGSDALAGHPGVQDIEMIQKLAANLLNASPPTTRIIDGMELKPAKAIDAFASSIERGAARVELPDGRPAELVQQRILSETDKPREITGHYLRSEDGQGLLAITRRQRTTEEVAERQTPSESPHARQPAGADDTSTEEAVEDRGVPLAQPSVEPCQVVLRTPDPRSVIRLLETLGLTGSEKDDGWLLDNSSLSIAGDRDTTPRLPLDPAGTSVELTVPVQDIPEVRKKLREAGWKTTERSGEHSVIEGGILVRLREESLHVADRNTPLVGSEKIVG